MRQNFRNVFLLSVLVVFSAVSCQKEAMIENTLEEMSFEAVSTKTELTSAHKVYWKTTDTIGVFSESSIYKFSTTDSGASATFTGLITPAAEYYAVYPYSAGATISSGKITTEIPSVQKAVAGSFADGANITVAKAEGSGLTFKNVCGLLQLTISRENIKSVTFKAKGEQKVAGRVEISVSGEPTYTIVSGESSVKLVAEGDALAPGTYYLAVLPQTYNGFTLRFVTKEGNFAELEGTKDLAVNRADGVNLGTVDTDIVICAAYRINLASVDWTKSYVHEAKASNGSTIAVICKEFLGTTANQQAITVYGTLKTTKMDSSNPIALVAQVLKQSASGYQTYSDVSATDPVHCGTFSFKSGATEYVTAGSKPAVTEVFAIKGLESGITTITSEPVEGAVDATVTARTLVLSDRGDTKAYMIAKINRLFWMAENLVTTKYNDDTDIKKATNAAALASETGAAYVAVSANVKHVYNGDVVLSGKIGTSDGWSVPSQDDATTLNSFCGSFSYTMNYAQNNVSGFSNRYAGRVTSRWESSLDAAYWCSNSKDSNSKMKCYVVRTDGTAPTTAEQSYKYGFWIRLKHTLY